MHMSDALVSPAVGGAFWAASGWALARSARTVSRDAPDGGVPLTGVLGAFIFAIQMVTFAIPGTGSSGHLGGGLLLALLLGPEGAFLTLASVLVVQALFFADGGLLALGCNLFNMGFIPAFVALPLAGNRRTPGILAAAVASALLGAAAVAFETRLSGITQLPLGAFLLALLPIHLVIGLVEGLATAAVLRFLHKARPELRTPGTRGWRPAALVGLLALVTAGGLSVVASRNPDGLEWAIARVAGREPAPPPDPAHLAAARLQASAPLPDYALKGREPGRAQTSLAGLAGGALTLALVAGAAFALRAFRKAA
ncbi:MAG TPA: energy-coupling factor ABC transporter permease [Holophaga sp.]|nr:energy-coupling factor ABC transporter permease [Holophaga sp.]